MQAQSVKTCSTYRSEWKIEIGISDKLEYLRVILVFGCHNILWISKLHLIRHIATINIAVIVFANSSVI